VNLGWADYRDHHLGPELKAFKEIKYELLYLIEYTTVLILSMLGFLYMKPTILDNLNTEASLSGILDTSLQIHFPSKVLLSLPGIYG